MAKDTDLEQLPNCEHFESTVSRKDEAQAVVPNDRQSIIRTKVSRGLQIKDWAKLILFEFDRRVLPIVCILYVLSYLDRGE
jgi:hypothetical protein